jgi:hypothetical protein
MRAPPFPGERMMIPHWAERIRDFERKGVAVSIGLILALTGVLHAGAMLRHRRRSSVLAYRVRRRSTPFPAQSSVGGQAPRLGRIEVGAFAPEAAHLFGVDQMSLPALEDVDSYATYRLAVRTAFGADLADMNYLAVGTPGWQDRYNALKIWLYRSSAYGDPTLALEPLGSSRYRAFRDGPEMRRLRSVFTEAKEAGITVWIRFASECNLRNSAYSVWSDPTQIDRYKRSVKWFKGYMPSNVRLVFSPLINTAYLRDRRQIETLKAMYVPGDYNRIGGTLYATTWLHPVSGYSWYYDFMRRLDPNADFQICELGGAFKRKAEVRRFLQLLFEGRWPKVRRVNLFDGALNPTATREHGQFGFIESGKVTSYLIDFFDKSADSSEL